MRSSMMPTNIQVRPLLSIILNHWQSTGKLTTSPDTNIQSSRSNMMYSPSHSASAFLHQSSPSAMSRLRASLSAFPPALDLRNQYRTLPAESNSPHGIPTPRSSSSANAFTGYASAPLTAPVDFTLPRTPNDTNPGGRDFNAPQLSAPMAAPQDFSKAYNRNLSPIRGQAGGRDFGNQGQNIADPEGQAQGQVADQEQQQQYQHSRGNEEAYMSSIEYERGQTRKRSFLHDARDV
jgi:hypothetical protein